MKKLIVFTHNAVRDPITDDCLSAALREKGHLVWRRNFLDNDKDMIVYVKPDVVILPESRCEFTRDLAEQCRKWGIQVVVRPCEVGISEESIDEIAEDYKRAIFGNWPVNDALDLMLCWGPKMKELFHQYGGIEKSKMEVVGGLAFDQFFLPPPPDEIVRTEKRRVLFATGFAYADRNPQYAMPEAAPNDPIHRNMVATDSKARSEWFKVIKQFWANHGNDWEIWVKLHPGEKEEVYHAVLKDTVTMCPNLPAVRALRYVDCVVHAGSTMAYEAHLMNKPAINLLNVCQDKIVNAISPPAMGYQDMVTLLERSVPKRGCELKSNADPDIIKILERDYYGTCDGHASERAAEFIDALPESKTNIPDHWPVNNEMKYITEAILLNVEAWECRACKHRYNVQGPREMVKCPYCGIACCKIIRPVEAM